MTDQKTPDESGKGKEPRGGIDQNLIRELAALLNETDLTEIEIEQNGLRLRVSRQVSAYAQAFPLTQAQAGHVQAPSSSAPAQGAQEAEGNDLASHPGVIKSPMVGTAYLGAEPGSPPFVREGDSVVEGQTIMIVEAMKTMNHIHAKRAGIVKRVLVANEQPVEFGEPLIIIE